MSSGDLAEKTVDTSQSKKLPVMRGILGHQIRSTGVRNISGLRGLTMVTPAAVESLLSSMQIVKHRNGSFSGDSKTLIVKNEPAKLY